MPVRVFNSPTIPSTFARSNKEMSTSRYNYPDTDVINVLQWHGNTVIPTDTEHHHFQSAVRKLARDLRGMLEWEVFRTTSRVTVPKLVRFTIFCICAATDIPQFSLAQYLEKMSGRGDASKKDFVKSIPGLRKAAGHLIGAWKGEMAGTRMSEEEMTKAYDAACPFLRAIVIGDRDTPPPCDVPFWWPAFPGMKESEHPLAIHREALRTASASRGPHAASPPATTILPPVGPQPNPVPRVEVPLPAIPIATGNAEPPLASSSGAQEPQRPTKPKPKPRKKVAKDTVAAAPTKSTPIPQPPAPLAADAAQAPVSPGVPLAAAVAPTITPARSAAAPGPMEVDTAEPAGTPDIEMLDAPPAPKRTKHGESMAIDDKVPIHLRRPKYATFKFPGACEICEAKGFECFWARPLDKPHRDGACFFCGEAHQSCSHTTNDITAIDVPAFVAKRRKAKAKDGEAGAPAPGKVVAKGKEKGQAKGKGKGKEKQNESEGKGKGKAKEKPEDNLAGDSDAYIPSGDEGAAAGRNGAARPATSIAPSARVIAPGTNAVASSSRVPEKSAPSTKRKHVAEVVIDSSKRPRLDLARPIAVDLEDVMIRVAALEQERVTRDKNITRLETKVEVFCECTSPLVYQLLTHSHHSQRCR